MKEVKVISFRELAERKSANIYREEVNKMLANYLNAGWNIAGTAGRFLDDGFVILVRERQE